VTLPELEYRLARPVWAEVSLDAITANLAVIRRLAGRPVKVIATLKANAYGHGAAAVGLHLQALGVDGLATANLDDALEMRRAGVTARIVMFAGNLPDGVGTLIAHGLTPTIQDMATAQAISRLASGPVNVHVKVDAGLGRLGVKLDEARDFVQLLARMPNIRVEGLYTHLPFSADVQADWSRRQLSAFTDLVATLEREDGIRIEYAQGAASAILASQFPDSLNTVAPGHLLFGLTPLAGADPAELGLTPALRAIKARLIHVASHGARTDRAPSGGYGATQAARTGVFLLGSDNGYGQPVTQDACVLCRGRRCRILGVTAEYTVIDLSSLREAAVGDQVTVVGRDGGDELRLSYAAAYLGVSPMIAAVSFRRIAIAYDGNGITPAYQPH
jgi:alanine racemase